MTSVEATLVEVVGSGKMESSVGVVVSLSLKEFNFFTGEIIQRGTGGIKRKISINMFFPDLGRGTLSGSL